MPGVVRTYTYQIAKPDDMLAATVAMGEAAELIHKFNKWVEAVEIMPDDEGGIIIRLTMKAHDQWQIKKKVIYPLASLLTKAGLTLKDARLLAVDQPEHHQKAWSEAYRNAEPLTGTQA